MRVLGEMACETRFEQSYAGVSSADSQSRHEAPVNVDICRIDAYPLIEQEGPREPTRFLAVRFPAFRGVDALKPNANRQTLAVAYALNSVPIDDSNDARFEGRADEVPDGLNVLCRSLRLEQPGPSNERDSG
jgi:hypothetical protein